MRRLFDLKDTIQLFRATIMLTDMFKPFCQYDLVQLNRLAQMRTLREPNLVAMICRHVERFTEIYRYLSSSPTTGLSSLQQLKPPLQLVIQNLTLQNQNATFIPPPHSHSHRQRHSSASRKRNPENRICPSQRVRRCLLLRPMA